MERYKLNRYLDTKVSLLGVVALWGDCTFIPAVADLCYVALCEDFLLYMVATD